MLNIGYFKGLPTEHILHYSGGKLARSGQGLAFFYLKHAAQIVALPTSSTDANLVFKEVTRDFQEVTLQGQFTYRIADPQRASQLLNFTIIPATRQYLSQDPDRLPQRISNVIQSATHVEVQSRTLEEVLGQYEAMSQRVQERVRSSGLLEPLGIELLGILFTTVRPNPEVAKALEADYRESLLRRADEAISARRAAAVEDERRIKENELNTDIALEQQRQALIALQGENARREAESEGQAHEIKARYLTEARQRELDLYRELEPRRLLALAIHEMGENAGRIGNLNITPEILGALLASGGIPPALGIDPPMPPADIDKIVVVTRATPLDELVLRNNTIGQARFYVEHSGGSFDTYLSFHEAYQRAIRTLREALPEKTRAQWIDRSFLPTFQFGPGDLVITLGPDGLVVNTAKYLDSQPVLALNPDPSRIDGVLLPFTVEQAGTALDLFLRGALAMRRVSMACARLNDGQELHAVNDLFIGQRTHVSARYQLTHAGATEPQSSSGIIVSTGAGSTGWYRSILTGASAIAAAHTNSLNAAWLRDRYAFDWESSQLAFSVREPFISKTSRADLAFGWITPEEPLVVASLMPSGGVIFSDGVEEDFLQFHSGAIATVGLSSRVLHLLMPARRSSRSRRE